MCRLKRDIERPLTCLTIQIHTKMASTVPLVPHQPRMSLGADRSTAGQFIAVLFDEDIIFIIPMQ